MISLIQLPENYWKDYEPKRRTQRDYKDLAMEIGVPVSVIKVSFSIYMAHYILHRIKKAVKTQQVKGKSMKSIYKPLSPAYKKTKPYGTKNKFWINKGILIETLGVYQTKAGTKRVTHIGWRGQKQFRRDQPKLSMRKQIVYLESRRPLIKPIINSAKSNVAWLWKRYKELVLSQNSHEIKFKLH